MGARQQAMAGDRPDLVGAGQIRFRPTVLQRFLIFAPTVTILAIFLVATVVTSGDMPRSAVVGALVGLLVGAGISALAARGFGALLSTDVLFVYGMTVRRIQLTDIEDIRIESFWGARRVVVYEAGGRKKRLRAPIGGFLAWDRRFEEKSDAIRQWWLGGGFRG